jgi:hypothetical protein
MGNRLRESASERVIEGGRGGVAFFSGCDGLNNDVVKLSKSPNPQ